GRRGVRAADRGGVVCVEADPRPLGVHRTGPVDGEEGGVSPYTPAPSRLRAPRPAALSCIRRSSFTPRRQEVARVRSSVVCLVSAGLLTLSAAAGSAKPP